MVKKLLLVSLFGVFFSGAMAQEYDIAEQLLRKVDLVLFVLQQDTVRMERYGLYELQSESNPVSEDLSKDHCAFSINMIEQDFKVHTVAWDQGHNDRIKIISGKKTPKTYSLLLEKLLSSSVQLEDLAMVCFDCTVEQGKVTKEDDSETEAEWKSAINIMVEAGDEKLAMQLIVNGKVDAACGLFVQNDAFCDMPLGGKIQKDEALDQGILIAQESVRNVCEAIEDIDVSDSYDEFDLLVDEAIGGGVLKKTIEFEQPSFSKRVLMWCAAPFVRLYISTVLNYRVVKGWVASRSGSLCGCCDAS